MSVLRFFRARVTERLYVERGLRALPRTHIHVPRAALGIYVAVPWCSGAAASACAGTRLGGGAAPRHLLGRWAWRAHTLLEAASLG